MKTLVVKAKDPFELMRNLPEIIHPADFPVNAISYFTFLPKDKDIYHIQIADLFYADAILFMEKVSSQLAGKEIYGFVSHFNNMPLLGFRGLHFMAEYGRTDDQWTLRCFEDFNTREQPTSERLLKIGSDIEKLKKLLS